MCSLYEVFFMARKCFILLSSLLILELISVSIFAGSQPPGVELNPTGLSQISWMFETPESEWKNTKSMGEDDHEGDDYYADDWARKDGNTRGQIAYAGISGQAIVLPFDSDGYGNHVVVYDNSSEFALRYAHLDEILVSNGQNAIAGSTAIGKVGSTGLSAGPHLHVVLYTNVQDVENRPVTQITFNRPPIPGPPTNFAAPFLYNPGVTLISMLVFAIVGTVKNANGTLAADGLEVAISNETKGLIATTTIGRQEPGGYGVVFIDVENKAVASEGDILKVTVKEDDNVLASQTHELTAGDIAKARAIIDFILVPVSESQPPVASFTHHPSLEEFLSGQEIIFDASGSMDPDGDIISYKWDFDDGETAEGSIVKHRFRGAMNQSKTYNITLKVEDSSKLTDSNTVSITVAPLEKTVKVSHYPIIPVPGQPVFAKITALYNWIYDDTYVVSKIHCEYGGFLGVGAISIWDFHSHPVPMPIWAEDIFCFSKEEEKTYYPKLHQILYGEDTFEGVKVDAFDAMNIYMMGWAGVSFSTGLSISPPFFETNSACFQPDYTEVPDVPLDIQTWDVAHLGSPAELRVYDSQERVTGLVDGKEKEEIPHSSYRDNTVIVLSSTDSYRYEVVGIDKGKYKLRTASVASAENKKVKATTFTATNIPTSAKVAHQYTIDWEALSKGEKGVSVQIDADSDGTFEQTIITDSELTQDEYLSITGVTPGDKYPLTWGSIKRTALFQNYPNPFNADTWIPYVLADPALVAIEIYTITGQLVRVLNLGNKPVGVYFSKGRAAHWDGRDNTGEPIASGVYFYTFQAGPFRATKKMVIAK